MPFWKKCLQSSTDVIIIIVINDYALLTINQHSVKMAEYQPSSFLQGHYPVIFTKQAWLVCPLE